MDKHKLRAKQTWNYWKINGIEFGKERKKLRCPVWKEEKDGVSLTYGSGNNAGLSSWSRGFHSAPPADGISWGIPQSLDTLFQRITLKRSFVTTKLNVFPSTGLKGPYNISSRFIEFRLNGQTLKLPVPSLYISLYIYIGNYCQ